MKPEDFNIVRESLKKEGFDIKSLEHADTYVIKPERKIDEWEGVEFAECVVSKDSSFTLGKIYKIQDGKTIDSYGAFIDNYGINNGWGTNNRKFFTPSNEQSYKEQLIQEAKERFGEIRGGDEFEREWLKGSVNPVIGIINKDYDWRYWKEADNLNYGGICIYEKGQWAKKIEKPEVQYLGGHDIDIGYSFSFKFKDIFQDYTAMGNHLTKCLKEYLSKK